MKNERFAIELTSYRAIELERGQAILSLILLIGGIIVLIGLALAFLATSFVNSAYGYRAAQRAEAVASSGVFDALMQLARNQSFSSTGYTLTVSSDTASVTVTQNSPATGQATVVSSSTVSLSTKTIRAIVSENTSTGQVFVVSWVPS